MLNRSVTRAAEELRTSQPTASRILAELEREIGFKLFLREGNRLAPTPEAVALHEEVQRSFVGLERIRAAAAGIANFRSDHLRLVSISSFALGPLAHAVPAFQKKFDGVCVAIEIHAYDEVVARVAARQAEVGFTAYPVRKAGVHARTIARVDAVCVMPRGHSLARACEVQARDLAAEPFIASLGHPGPSRDAVDRAFAQAGVERRTVIETQTGVLACSLVLQGAGVAVLDPFTATAFADKGLVIRPFRPTVSFGFNAVLPADQAPARITREFLKSLRETLGELTAAAKRRAGS